MISLMKSRRHPVAGALAVAVCALFVWTAVGGFSDYQDHPVGNIAYAVGYFSAMAAIPILLMLIALWCLRGKRKS